MLELSISCKVKGCLNRDRICSNCSGPNVVAVKPSLHTMRPSVDFSGSISPRSPSSAWILNQATDRYLEYEEWFVQQVEKGVADATRGDILSHDQVITELRSKVEKANSS